MRRFALPCLHRLLPGLLLLLLPLAATASEGSAAPISVTEGGSRVVAVSAGRYHACGLKADGSVSCWGLNLDGQLDGTPSGATTGSVSGPFVLVSAGEFHTCGLKADGSVSCWGDNANGQLNGTPNAASSPVPGPFVSVSAGRYHSCGLKADGSVSCWGSNNQGQLNGTPSSASSPVPGPFVSVSAGLYHTCGLKADGNVSCWGWNAYGQLNGTPSGATTGSVSGPFLSVSAGDYHSCGVKADGSVSCWGDNSSRQLDGTLDNVHMGNVSGPFVSVSAGYLHTCGIKADGSVSCWGYNYYGQTNIPTPNGPFLSVSAGVYNTCAMKADGSVSCWGAGEPGSNGTYDQGQSTVPADLQLPGATAFGQIAAGNAHACQVRRDGTLACWGLNDEGQVNAPAGLFTQVVAGDSHSCAIGTDGQLTCWGRNAAATTSALNGPWRQLAPAPDGAVCALKAGSGEDRCSRGGYYTAETGYKASGRFRNITHNIYQLYQGLCGVLSKEMPDGSDSYCGVGGPFGNSAFDNVHVNYFTGGYQRIESGIQHQCGLKLDGSIECWGSTANQQLDNMPASTETFRAFSVGWNHACAIRDNGTLACWGSNQNGQATPPVGTYVQVAAGNTFTCAIRSNGTRVCWGSNNHGQAPQLALNPASIAGGQVNTAHAGATFALTEDDYLPDLPAYAVVAGSLPPGLSLSAAGVLSGTPTAGGTFTFTVEGEDANGFTASREYTVTIIADSTPPQIGYTLTPAAPDGSNGWYVSDIGIDWMVSDAESSVSGIIGCVDETLNTDTTGTTRSCTASSLGGSASLTTEVLKRDATAPTITATETSTPDGNNGWYRSNATVHFTCTDATSGVASCPADQVLSSDGSAVSSAAQTAQDVAGNTSAASNVVTVKIDQTAPTLNPTTPDPLLRGQSYVASPNASDATSGIASSSCGALDTSSLGSKSTTCSATDNAGNGNTVTLHYTVTTTCANDGYSSTQLQWCVQICESGLTGKPLEDWIKRWFTRYRNYPYCVAP